MIMLWPSHLYIEKCISSRDMCVAVLKKLLNRMFESELINTTNLEKVEHLFKSSTHAMKSRKRIHEKSVQDSHLEFGIGCQTFTHMGFLKILLHRQQQ